MVRVVDVVDRDVGPPLRVERERARLAQPAVGVELDPAVDHLEAEVRDRDERAVRQAARRGADRERDDRLVVRLAPDLEHAHGRLERALGRRGQRRVGRDEDLGVPGACGERGGEAQRVTEVADIGRRLDRRDRLLDPPEVRRPVGHDLGRPPRGHDADLAARREVLERIDREGLRRVEPARRHVGRLHRGRGVHHQHDVAREAGRSLHERARGEDREDHDEQELEQQQQAPAELLPRRVRLHVRDELVPQQRGRHDGPVPAQLEQVHRHDDGQEQQPGEGERRQEAHLSPPRAGGGARRTRGPRAGCPSRSARTRRGA